MNSQDTIVALSSAAPAAGQAAVSIIRLSGPGSPAAIRRFLTDSNIPARRGLVQVTVNIEGLAIPACLYVFPSPHSYTGQDMNELHIAAAGPVVEALYKALLTCVRQAGPGEFTLRADLTGAEAVAQIVSGSNAAQVAAAEKLLAGNLSSAVGDIRRQILDLLSRLEAGLDFAEEDIEFVSAEQAAEVLASLTARLEDLLGSTIQYERMIDLPSVGIAGAVSAGKSSLLNALLERHHTRCTGGDPGAGGPGLCAV
jgi:tRNA modification GTPase